MPQPMKRGAVYVDRAVYVESQVLTVGCHDYGHLDRFSLLSAKLITVTLMSPAEYECDAPSPPWS